MLGGWGKFTQLRIGFESVEFYILWAASVLFFVSLHRPNETMLQGMFDLKALRYTVY